jgi:hypothetical protein
MIKVFKTSVIALILVLFAGESTSAAIEDSFYRFKDSQVILEIGGNDNLFAGPDTIYKISNSVVSRFENGRFDIISKIPQLIESNGFMVTYGNNIFLATNGNELFLSNDAITWRKSFDFPKDLRSNPIGTLVFKNGKFLAIGGAVRENLIMSFPVYSSSDGITWQTSEIKIALADKDESLYFNLIDYSRGVYLVIGNKMSLRSEDFLSWRTSGIGQALKSDKASMAISGSTVIVTTVSMPIYWRSEDLGLTWAELTSPGMSYVSKVAFQKNHFVMTSSNFQRDSSYSYTSTTGKINDWKVSRMPVSSEYWSEIFAVRGGELLYVFPAGDTNPKKILIAVPKSDAEIAEENRQLAEARAKVESEAKILAEAQERARQAQAEAQALAAAELKAKQEAADKAASAKKITITCIKGKTLKKVKAVNPKCPKGYSKK